jgi:gas vesicle structural protein
MTVSSVNRAPRPSSLADVLDVVLDKGIVIDAYVRIALVGIELLTIDARIVIASVDTYLRFAEAVNRLDIQPQDQVAGLPGLMHEITGDGGSRRKTRGALQGAKETAQDVMSSLTGGGRRDDDDEDDGEERKERGVPASRRAPSRG